MLVVKQHENTIDHVTSECPILEKNEYLKKHDTLGEHLHCSLCKALGMERTDRHTWPSEYVNMKM